MNQKDYKEKVKEVIKLTQRLVKKLMAKKGITTKEEIMSYPLNKKIGEKIEELGLEEVE